MRYDNDGVCRIQDNILYHSQEREGDVEAGESKKRRVGRNEDFRHSEIPAPPTLDHLLQTFLSYAYPTKVKRFI